MRCKVVIFHHVRSSASEGWRPLGFDSNTGFVDVKQWRHEFSDDIPSIKSFDDSCIDVAKLHDQIILNIKGKFDAGVSCGLNGITLWNRYVVISPDEIDAEYADGVFDRSEDRKHKFTVHITPL